ncbi:MAG: FKBP-type peptidyl-prolyl cis-trans isomerase, partial [Verrucomicrobia bacterium]|nr:FKBP-type peptidyl-prolyl cis-trans isomerase [Cytophagales bacterium]
IEKYLGNNLTSFAKTSGTFGTYYQITNLKPDSIKPTAGLLASVTYKGYLLSKLNDGSVVKGNLFDATTTVSKPLIFGIDNTFVIQGFNDAVKQMRKGEKATFLLPSCLAFGSRESYQGQIPAYATLLFEDVELLDVRTEDQVLQQYIKANNIVVTTKTSSGLYYASLSPGTGNFPTDNQNITVSYVLKFATDGTIVQQNPAFPSVLSNLIDGWKEGIKLMKVGEKAILLMPSSLAYKSTGSGAIPPYTPLVFEITLISATG